MSTRRQLFRAMFAGAASLPFAALSQSLADGTQRDNNQTNKYNGGDKNDGRGSQGYNDRGYAYGKSSGDSGGSSGGDTGGSTNAGGYSNGGGYAAGGSSNGYGSGGGGGGGSVRQSAGCLLKGTRIATPSGECLVEELRIGDEVLTLSGPKPARWVGYDKFTKAPERRWHNSVMPVRLERFAINDHSPQNALFLSPLHCILFNESLIPIKYLINGSSIVQRVPPGMSAIEYYHIDLGTHEVIYAEGASVESFWDGVSGREAFANFVQYERLYGAEPLKMKPFAPILDYCSRAQRMAGTARDLISNVVDIRDQIQVARDELARRAEALFV